MPYCHFTFLCARRDAELSYQPARVHNEMQSVSVEDDTETAGQTSKEAALKKQNLLLEVMKFIPQLLRLPSETRVQLSKVIEIKAYSTDTVIYHVGQENSKFIYFVSHFCPPCVFFL